MKIMKKIQIGSTIWTKNEKIFLYLLVLTWISLFKKPEILSHTCVSYFFGLILYPIVSLTNFQIHGMYTCMYYFHSWLECSLKWKSCQQFAIVPPTLTFGPYYLHIHVWKWTHRLLWTLLDWCNVKNSSQHLHTCTILQANFKHHEWNSLLIYHRII